MCGGEGGAELSVEGEVVEGREGVADGGAVAVRLVPGERLGVGLQAAVAEQQVVGGAEAGGGSGAHLQPEAAARERLVRVEAERGDGGRGRWGLGLVHGAEGRQAAAGALARVSYL